MTEKNTAELNNILCSTHTEDIAKFISDNSDSLIEPDHYFYSYLKEIMKKNNILQQEVFLQADIPERYGYKLLSGEKHTRQRDIILRICYAAKLTLKETQKALKAYGMPELYSKIARDAALMICINERPGSILDVNSFLKKNDLTPLRSCGTLD